MATNQEVSQKSNDWISHEIHAANNVEKAADKADYDVREVSYAMIVIQLMDKVGMGPIEKVMNAEADLEDIIAKIQGEMVTLSKYLSMIENNSTSTPQFHYYDFNHGSRYQNQQNGYNGFAPGFMDSGGTFDKQTQSFVNSFKQLFFSANGNTGKTLGDISKITTTDGTTYDISGYWNDLAGSYAKFDNPKSPAFSYTDSDGKVHNLIDAPSNGASSDSASMFQIYVYAKLQLAVLQKGSFGSTTPDFENIFYPDPSNQATDDGICSTLTQFLQSFDTSVNVKRDGVGNDNPNDSANYESTNSGNILDLMVHGELYDVNDPTVACWGHVRPGLETAVSYMSFNYFWTKNPSYNDTKNDPYPMGGSKTTTAKGIAQGDLLSDTYGGATNVQSLVGSTSQEQTTDMQEKTSEMGQFDNIGQNIVSQDAKANGNTVQNDTSA